MCLCGVHNTPCLYCMAKGLENKKRSEEAFETARARETATGWRLMYEQYQALYGELKDASKQLLSALEESTATVRHLSGELDKTNAYAFAQEQRAEAAEAMIVRLAKQVP